MLAFETGIHDTIGIDLVKAFLRSDFLFYSYFNFISYFVYGFGGLSVIYSV